VGRTASFAPGSTGGESAQVQSRRIVELSPYALYPTSGMPELAPYALRHRLGTVRNVSTGEPGVTTNSAMKAKICKGKILLAVVQEPVKNADAEPQAVDRDALVDPVEHSGKIQIWWQFQRTEPETPDS
jgi:hypothetical protein